VLEVQDRGKGIAAEKLQKLAKVGQAGVGFNGMRERLRQLGGTLGIRSEESGTLVRAILPISQSEERAGNESPPQPRLRRG